MKRFEEEYTGFMQQQLRGANGMRLEMLKKHGAGEKSCLSCYGRCSDRSTESFSSMRL